MNREHETQPGGAQGHPGNQPGREDPGHHEGRPEGHHGHHQGHHAGHHGGHHPGHDHGHHPHPHEITLVIAWADEDGEFTVKRTETIAELIQAAVAKFGLASGDKYELMAPGQKVPLSQGSTVEALGLKDREELLLTSTGGGV